MSRLCYDVAISFAGENRKIAETFARRLDGSGYSVFYDEYELDRLWGSDLTVKLGEVYGGMARFCLMIVSEYYVKKMWTNHERQYAISQLLQKGGDYILPLKVDDSEIPGLPPTIGYLRLKDRSVDDVYQILLRKLGDPIQSKQIDRLVSANDEAKIQELIEACYRRAIFTKMDSEIRLSAMFLSLQDCMRRVQLIVPSIRNQGLQYLALQIEKNLDELERIGSRYTNKRSNDRNGREDWSYGMPSIERQKIDKIKLNIIDKLLELRRMAGITITLPTTLEFDHFYSVDDANQKPRN